jgi:hypothetical protein
MAAHICKSQLLKRHRWEIGGRMEVLRLALGKKLQTAPI